MTFYKIKKIIAYFRLAKNEKRYNRYLQRIKIYNKYNKWLKRWIMLYQDGKNITDYLDRYMSVAIYGMGDVGQLFLRECEKNGKNIICTIDQDAEIKNSCVPIYKLNENIPKIDCVVLTIYTGDDSLKDEISEKLKCKVISFEELLDMYTSYHCYE